MQCFPEITQIDKKLLQKYPLKGFEGAIHVVDTEDLVDNAIDYLSSRKIIGFDTETRPSFKKGKVYSVALLQLSSETDAFLFRLNTIKLSSRIIQLLSDTTVLKIGAAIHDDIKDLNKLAPFEDNGFIDLQSYVKQFNIESFGVKKLSALVLGFRITKSQQVSNWENKELTEAQLKYAATDAWVCLEIFKKLKEFE